MRFALVFQEKDDNDSLANTTVDKSVTVTSVPTQKESTVEVVVEPEPEQEEIENKKALESDSGFVVDQQSTVNNQSPVSSGTGSGIHLEVAESHTQSQSQSPGSMSDLELIIPVSSSKKTMSTGTSECLGDDTSSFT